MRLFLFAVAALLAACGRTPAAQSNAQTCSLSATHQVEWSTPGAPDTITARAEGPACGQAVVTLIVRNAAGDPLLAFADTHYALTTGDGLPGASAPPVTETQLTEFLSAWARVTEMKSRELPAWRDDAATLSESAATFSYDTPFERDVYEMLRARDLPMICFAAGAEYSQCHIIDPASGAPSRMVTYGP